MYDYQVMVAAFRRKNGLGDPDDDIITTDDLDELYSRIQLPEE